MQRLLGLGSGNINGEVRRYGNVWGMSSVCRKGDIISCLKMEILQKGGGRR